MLLNKKFIQVCVVAATATLLAACNHHPTTSQRTAFSSSSRCVGNAFLQKYGCSLSRVQRSAQRGDPDAQYALGYMYYYGVGTIRDPETAKLWIGKAAAQGQPLAKRAERLLLNGAHIDGAPGEHRRGTPPPHQSHPDVDRMNHATPSEPLKNHMPNYDSNSGGNAVPKSLKKEPSTPSYDKEKVPGVVKPPPVSMKKNDPRLAPGAKPMVAEAIHRAAEEVGRQAMSLAERQLMRVQSNHYTLQLMGSHDLRAVEDFIKRNQLQDKTRYYSTLYRGSKWYTLVYGNYATASRAHAAAHQLPSRIRALHPWVKSLALIKKEISAREILS